MLIAFHGIDEIGLRTNLFDKKRRTAAHGLNIIEDTGTGACRDAQDILRLNAQLIVNAAAIMGDRIDDIKPFAMRILDGMNAIFEPLAMAEDITSNDDASAAMKEIKH